MAAAVVEVDLDVVLEELQAHRASLDLQQQRTRAQVEILALQNIRLRRSGRLGRARACAATSAGGDSEHSTASTDAATMHLSFSTISSVVHSFCAVLESNADARARLVFETDRVALLLTNLFEMRTGLATDIAVESTRLAHTLRADRKDDPHHGHSPSAFLSQLSPSSSSAPTLLMSTAPRVFAQNLRLKESTALAEKSTLELIQRWRLFWKTRLATSNIGEDEYTAMFAAGDESAISVFCKDLVRNAISNDEPGELEDKRAPYHAESSPTSSTLPPDVNASASASGVLDSGVLEAMENTIMDADSTRDAPGDGDINSAGGEYAWIHAMRPGFVLPSTSAPMCTEYEYASPPPAPSAAATTTTATVAAAAAAAAVDNGTGKEQDSDDSKEVQQGVGSITDSGEHEIVLEESGEHLRAASTRALIVLMTHSHRSDMNVRSVFLLTYRKFMTPLQLLKKMVHRFLVPMPHKVSSTSSTGVHFRKMHMAPIQIKVFEFLKLWLDKHDYDFIGNATLVDGTRQFLMYVRVFPECTGPWSRKTSLQLLKLLPRNQPISGRSKINNIKSNNKLKLVGLPPSILPPGGVGSASFAPRSDDTMDTACLLNPIEVARQFTLVDQAVFCAIRAPECLRKAWTKPDRRAKEAPNIWKMIQRFEKTVEWVTTQIVRHANVDDRAMVLEWTINVAAEMLMLDNFHGAYAFYTAMNSAPVKRLKAAMGLVIPKKRLIFEDLRRVFRPDQSCQSMRQAMNGAELPCIPHLGIFLGDLTVLDEFDTKLGDKINFRKCRRIAGIIERLLEYQAQEYAFREVCALATHVRTLPGRLSRKKAMERSKLVEPKGGNMRKLKSTFNRVE